jgi:hypothetical protein
MTVQVGAKPPTRTTASTVIAHDSNVLPKSSMVRNRSRCRQSELGGKHDAHQTANITAEDRPSMARRLVAAGGVALVIGGSCLFAGVAGVAAADEVGYHHTSSYPAAPTWPAPPSWGSFPATASWPAPPSWGSLPVASTWPGDSSHPCCSR